MEENTCLYASFEKASAKPIIDTYVWKFFQHLTHPKFPPYYVQFNLIKAIEKNIKDEHFSFYQSTYLTAFSNSKFHYSQFYSDLILIP